MFHKSKRLIFACQFAVFDHSLHSQTSLSSHKAHNDFITTLFSVESVLIYCTFFLLDLLQSSLLWKTKWSVFDAKWFVSIWVEIISSSWRRGIEPNSSEIGVIAKLLEKDCVGVCTFRL